MLVSHERGVTEIGGNSGERVATGEVYSKQVARLPDLEGRASAIPERGDYERLVGWSISTITDPRWGLNEWIPTPTFRVEDNPRMLSGCSCWIDMPKIEGQLLSGMEQVPSMVQEQLAEFLAGSRRMAMGTKSEQGTAYFPDLLGGMVKATDRFSNFMVDPQQRLWFVDVYPLASLNWRTRGRYRSLLVRAADRMGSDCVVKAAEELRRVI